MNYVVRSLDCKSNEIVEQHVDAAGADEARQRIAGLGNQVISVRARPALATRAPKRIDLLSFCIELRALLSAGLTAVESLEALAAVQPDAERAAALRHVVTLVRSGKPLAAAFAAEPRQFPALFCSAIKGGEASGSVEASLAQYKDYLDMVDGLRRAVIGAAIYPAVVVAFGLLVMVFLIGYVIPRFAAAFTALPAGNGAQDHGLVLAVGMFVGTHWQILLAVALGAALLAWRVLRSSQGRERLLALVTARGPLASMANTYHRANVLRTQALMLEAGYQLPEAIGLSADVVDQTDWARRLRAAQRLISEGKPVAEAFAAQRISSELSTRLIAAGEKSGKMAAMIAAAASHHERELTWLVERFSRVVEPALLIVVAVMIGAIVFAMYMPVFDLISAF
jgi:general secretion pathway protein F